MEGIERIQTKNVLVIGDVMLDKYYFGEVKRISPEAPVPVFKKISEKSVLGGAANVASNLIAANQKVSIMSVVGDDDGGNLLEKYFLNQGISTKLLLKSNRDTTIKTRFIASNNQQVLRLDVEDVTNICNEEKKVLLNQLREEITTFDLIIISDYLKGLLPFDFTQDIITIANENNVKVIVDVKDPNSLKYANAYLIKPNLVELKSLTQMPVESDEEIIEASNSLREKTNCEFVLTTCGARGMILVGNNIVFKVNSVGKEVFDVTGAGDTTISYLGACIANNIDMEQSIKISNLAAGIQVSKVGTSAVYLYEVIDRMVEVENNYNSKIINGNLQSFREYNKNKKIVFTNGCFDIIHAGHVKYLEEAKRHGDILVVGVNSDESIRRLKGKSRPINTLVDRIEVLTALSSVDYVIPFEEDTPYDLIKEINPDVLVKGGNYKVDEIVGKDIVEQRGGKVIAVDFFEGKSTTNIVNKIKKGE